jgi:ubiquinone/menaquinone biosynthesis C-methylase UbiE
VIEEVFIDNKERIREHLCKFTRKAFQMLPPLDKPRILDVGCGSGVPTMELARLTNGKITAIDINPELITRLEAKVEVAGLSDRIKAITCSMFEMDFPEDSFDIVWAEGSIAPIGFERGLREWKRWLKKGGFLAVHDERSDIPQKLDQIATSGYDLLGYFGLDEQTWRNEYYSPLRRLINEAREQSAGDPEALSFLDREQEEIEVFKKNPAQCCSVFFVLRKR